MPKMANQPANNLEETPFLTQVRKNYLTPSHPTAFAGQTALKNFYGSQLSQSDIEKLLSSIYSYGIHREYKKPRVRNPYYIYHIREQVQIDLVIMKDWVDVYLPDTNNGIIYLCTAIDSFTRRAWVVPMRTKTAQSSLEAIRSIVENMQASPPFKSMRSVLFDSGTEFKNLKIRKYLTEQNIKLIHPTSEIKAGIVERFNRSLKSLIYSFMTENETNHYLSSLPDLLKTYNNRGHRSIGLLSPLEAEKPENQAKVLQFQLKRFEKIEKKRRKTAKFRIGDIVRVRLLDLHRFRRGFHHQFSSDYFQVVEIKNRMSIHMYVVKSLNTKEILKRRFYAGQLQLVTGEIYRINKILKERRFRGKLQYFVSWMYFDEQHNSWIDASQVVSTYNQS